MAESQTTDDDATTVSEFIPADKVHNDDRPMLKTLQAVEGGGLEEASHEPYDDTVRNHVYICDECGESFDTEDGAAHHTQYNH